MQEGTYVEAADDLKYGGSLHPELIVAKGTPGVVISSTPLKSGSGIRVQFEKLDRPISVGHWQIWTAVEIIEQLRAEIAAMKSKLDIANG